MIYESIDDIMKYLLRHICYSTKPYNKHYTIVGEDFRLLNKDVELVNFDSSLTITYMPEYMDFEASKSIIKGVKENDFITVSAVILPGTPDDVEESINDAINIVNKYAFIAGVKSFSIIFQAPCIYMSEKEKSYYKNKLELLEK